MNDSDFQSRLDRLHEDIVAQGDRVLEQATLAFDAYFDHDQDLARQATAIESEVDRVDVEIERRSIPLLALGQTDEYAIRSVLTIVKINNEFERIGDNANAIAEATLDPRRRAPSPARGPRPGDPGSGGRSNRRDRGERSSRSRDR